MQTTCLNKSGWGWPHFHNGEWMAHSHFPGLKCQLNKSTLVMLDFQLNTEATTIIQAKFAAYGLYFLLSCMFAEVMC